MATLFKRPDTGRYVLSYVDPFTRKQVRITVGADKAVAELALKKAEEQLALAKLGVVDSIQLGKDARKKPEQKPEMTLSQFIDYYEKRCIEDIENAESTIKNNKRALNHLIEVVGDKPISQVTDNDLVRWKSGMLKKLSRTSCAIYFRHVKASFSRMFKWRLIPANPFFYVEPIKEHKESLIQKKHMTAEEVQRLLKAIDEEGDYAFRLFVLFSLYTGARRSEMVCLRWDAIDEKKGTIRLYQVKTKREIEIPLSKPLAGVIASVDTRKEGYIFQTRSRKGGANKTEKPWSVHWVTHRFRHFVLKAGLPEQLHLHSLRHSFSMNLIEQGVPREVVSRLLGHANLATVQAYDHAAALSFRQYADKLDFGIGNAD
jgi:site-specific recombinase XerD